MITDNEARNIAAQWHGGMGTALYAFASTGAIDTGRDDHNLEQEVWTELLAIREDQTGPIAEGYTFEDWRDLLALLLYVLAAGRRARLIAGSTRTN